MIRRGDIYLVDFEPVVGSEADKKRPAIFVTNDGANARASDVGRGVLAVVPVTSNTKRVLPFQVLMPASLTGLRRDSKAQVEQLRSVDFSRIGDRVGSVPDALMRLVDDALRLHLDL
jgi:mRNA interferase MazF